MATSAPVSSGLLGSLRGLLDSLMGVVNDRIELFTIELHEEKYRLIQVFIWISAAVFSAMMAVTLASVTVIYLFWETARLAALIGLTSLYSIAFLVVVLRFRTYLANQPKPFSATLSELKQDRACIQKET